jgi:hypothetical protein
MHGLPSQIGRQRRADGRCPGVAEFLPCLLVEETQHIHDPGPHNHRCRNDPDGGISGGPHLPKDVIELSTGDIANGFRITTLMTARSAELGRAASSF